MDAHKDEALRKKYSSSLMSNPKWRKLFMVMAEYGADFSGMEYHFTDTDKVFYGHAPSAQQIWETAIDDPVEGLGGPVEYRHIESILIPKVYTYRAYEGAPRSEKPLDTRAFLQALANLGEFPVTETEKGLVIHGYKT